MPMIAVPLVSDAALWCGGTYLGPNAPLLRTWRNDSREVCPGDAFVALKGETADGHFYVDKAVERGAGILLIDEEHARNLAAERDEFKGVSILIAKDTVAALARIAANNLQAIGPTVVGITGSVGKTTTRELAAAVLESKYRVHSAVRSYNTVIGCSLTVLAMPLDTEILILEYGTNHFGEIGEIVSYFPPDLAVITEVAPAHLEGFGDISGVLRAKMEICSQPGLKCLVYNGDNELLEQAVERECACVRRIGVGSSSAEVKILDVVVRIEENGALCRASYDLMGEDIIVEAAVFGTQHAYNIGYALAVGKYLGVDTKKSAAAIKIFQPLSGRGELKKINGASWVVDEAYNASPRSMEAAISNVMKVSKLRNYDLYAILGGMREMGSSSSYWHQRIADRLGGFKKVFLYGSEWNNKSVSIPENAVYCGDIEELIQQALQLKTENIVVLIKGSNSYALKRIVALLTEGTNAY